MIMMMIMMIQALLLVMTAEAAIPQQQQPMDSTGSSTSSSWQQQSQSHSIPSLSSSSSSLEGSIFAESALIDKETGRIFWESGGTQSTVSKSILFKLGLDRHFIFGPYLTAKMVSIFLFLAIIGYCHEWLRQQVVQGSIPFLPSCDWLQQQQQKQQQQSPKNLYTYLSILCVWFLQHVILCVPRFDNWYVLTDTTPNSEEEEKNLTTSLLVASTVFFASVKKSQFKYSLNSNIVSIHIWIRFFDKFFCGGDG